MIRHLDCLRYHFNNEYTDLIMNIQTLWRSTICLMFSLGCLFGCGDDGHFETVEMPLHSVDIIVSKQRPAKVRITATGYAGG